MRTRQIILVAIVAGMPFGFMACTDYLTEQGTNTTKAPVVTFVATTATATTTTTTAVEATTTTATRSTVKATTTTSTSLLDGEPEEDEISELQEDDPRWDCATMGNLICGPAR